MNYETQMLTLDRDVHLERIETGVVQFGEDWPGIFIRGDTAFGFAVALNAHLNAPAQPENITQINRMLLQGLAQLLVSCDVHQRGLPEYPGGQA